MFAIAWMSHRHAQGEQRHAEFLANKIVALGCEPASMPTPVPRAKGNHAMLKPYWRRSARRSRTAASGVTDVTEFSASFETGRSDKMRRKCHGGNSVRVPLVETVGGLYVVRTGEQPR